MISQNPHITSFHSPTELRLIGLGPEVPDESVVSFLNAFGQVISPIERRSYKGVEIWERTIRLHLVTPHPSTLCISGYSVTLTVVQEGRNYCLLDTSQTPVNPNVSLANPSAGIELLKSDTGTDSKNPSNKSGNTRRHFNSWWLRGVDTQFHPSLHFYHR